MYLNLDSVTQETRRLGKDWVDSVPGSVCQHEESWPYQEDTPFSVLRVM